jgi:hypothetical protein
VWVFIRSLLDYTDVIYDNCSKIDTDKLEHVQHRACIIATEAIRLTKHETLLQEVGLETYFFFRYNGGYTGCPDLFEIMRNSVFHALNVTIHCFDHYSTVNQLIAFTHKIYKAIDFGHDVCAIFLDVSKAFDKVWHEGLIFKLKQIGISK